MTIKEAYLLGQAESAVRYGQSRMVAEMRRIVSQSVNGAVKDRVDLAFDLVGDASLATRLTKDDLKFAGQVAWTITLLDEE